MSGRFPLYTDADIRGPLIKQLRRAGWDVVRAVDEYPERTKDPIHFERAVQLGRVLVTSDEDHEAIAVEWYRAQRSFPGLIIWRQELNEQLGYGALLKAFEDLADQDNPFGEYPIIRIWPRRWTGKHRPVSCLQGCDVIVGLRRELDTVTHDQREGEGHRAHRRGRASVRGDHPDRQRASSFKEGPMSEPIPSEYRGWWRIIETSQWVDDGLDILGPAVISLTGHADGLRMHCLLAYVNCKPTKTGVSFTWEGAWEYDQMSGSGRVTLGKDGRLKGVIRIKDGDSSTFVAVRAEEPEEPIPRPPSYRDKWRRGW